MKRITTIRQQWDGPGWAIGLSVSIDEANGAQVAAAGHVVEAVERFIAYHLPDSRVVTPPATETEDNTDA